MKIALNNVLFFLLLWLLLNNDAKMKLAITAICKIDGQSESIENSLYTIWNDV